MKTIGLLVMVCILAAGCVTRTEATKNVVVTKDAQGNVLGIVETETVTQKGRMKPLVMTHIKVRPTDTEAAAMKVE